MAKLLERLCERYPSVPAVEAGGANDEFSTYLHLLVNWLEIEAVSQFIGRDRVLSHVRALPFYRWIYQAVTDNWEALGALYREQGLLPVRLATDMSADDLKLAALVDESPAQ
jgi:hypothetical protein